MKKIIFFNLFAIIIIFFSLEIFLRFFNIITLQGFDKNSFFRDAGIIYHHPNILKTVMGKKIKTDNNGFRIPLENFDYNNNLETILILGDSVSFGVGVDEKDTFVGLLRSKIKYNLYNSSVAGHRWENYSFLLEKYHKQFPKIDKVFIFLCLNDIISDDGVVRKDRLKIQSENKNFINNIKTKSLFIKVNFYLREKSTVFNLAKAVGTQNIKRNFDFINPYYKNELILKHFEKNIKKIIDYSNLNKINTSFVLLPYKYQIKKNCDIELMFPQSQINKIFSKFNYKLIDFSKEFCDKNNNNKLFLNFDPMHLSINGHMFVSQLLINEGIIN